MEGLPSMEHETLEEEDASPRVVQNGLACLPAAGVLLLLYALSSDCTTITCICQRRLPDRI